MSKVKAVGAAINVMLADDHVAVREGLAAIIGREPDMAVAALVANGREAIAEFRRQRPDITLMDLRMPEVGGVEAISSICGEFPGARLIVLTTYDGDEDIYRALRAGARGYLLKDAPAEELLQAIRAVHSGHKRIQPEVAQKLAERVSGDQLTEREGDVLRLLVGGKSNAEIAQELSIAEGTVKFHITHILEKLGVTDRTQAVIVALRRGLAHL